VNPVVGQRITEWEQARAASQFPRTDRKTGAKVHYLFSHRGHSISLSYINTSLIPTLCKVAGIPRTDERGTIASQRARATLATLLHNAPEGLSLFELMRLSGAYQSRFDTAVCEGEANKTGCFLFEGRTQQPVDGSIS